MSGDGSGDSSGDSSVFDDLLGDVAEAIPDSGIDVDLGSLDIDLGGLDLAGALATAKQEPLEVIHNPIDGQLINTADVSQVVGAFIALNSVTQSLDLFKRELQKAALSLATGTTKTRRLTAEVDGELRTIVVNMPDEYWSSQELGSIAAWCNRPDASPALKAAYGRFVREVTKVERSPIKKETKKLLNESFPEGSELSELRNRLLSANKGTTGKLPTLKIEGDTLSAWEQRQLNITESGDSDTEEG